MLRWVAALVFFASITSAARCQTVSAEGVLWKRFGADVSKASSVIVRYRPEDINTNVPITPGQFKNFVTATVKMDDERDLVTLRSLLHSTREVTDGDLMDVVWSLTFADGRRERTLYFSRGGMSVTDGTAYFTHVDDRVVRWLKSRYECLRPFYLRRAAR